MRFPIGSYCGYSSFFCFLTAMFLFVPATDAREDSTSRYIRDCVFTEDNIWILTDENVIMRGRDERQWHEIVKKDSWRTLFQIVDMCVTANDTILLLSSGAWGREYRPNGEYIGIAGRGVSDTPSNEQRLACTSDGAVWLIHPEGV